MPTIVYSQSYHTALGNGVSLGDDDQLYVAAGATLSSGDSYGVWASGTTHFLNIHGTVVGDGTGILLEGPGSLVRIHAGGQVEGMGNAGITLEGYNHQLDNAGYVYGSFYGVNIYGTGLGEGSSIANKGTIEGYFVGVYHGGDSAAGPHDPLTLVNTGTIRSLTSSYSFFSVDDGGLVDIIANTGLMIGAIEMGDGADRIDTSRGTVLGRINLGEGNDVALGSAAADSIYGSGGDDFIRGGRGNDTMDGGMGRDTADYGDKSVAVQVKLNGSSEVAVTVGGVFEDLIAGFETIVGGSGGDRLTGDELANLLRGNSGNDSLVGAGGRDTIVGGAGKDVLTGGASLDRFVFDTGLGSGNIDKITDFSHVDDTIALDLAIFRAISSPWSAAQFRAVASGHVATTASQHVIYDKSNGTLWYDDDGKGAHAAIQFATLTNKPADLSFNDFVTFAIT